MATKEKIKSEAMKEVKHMQSKSDGTKDMKQIIDFPSVWNVLLILIEIFVLLVG